MRSRGKVPRIPEYHQYHEVDLEQEPDDGPVARQPGAKPAAEEQDHRQRGYGECVDVLGQEEQRPVGAAVFYERPAHDLRLCEVDVEGCPANLGQPGDEEDHEAQRAVSARRGNCSAGPLLPEGPATAPALPPTPPP